MFLCFSTRHWRIVRGLREEQHRSVQLGKSSLMWWRKIRGGDTYNKPQKKVGFYGQLKKGGGINFICKSNGVTNTNGVWWGVILHPPTPMQGVIAPTE